MLTPSKAMRESAHGVTNVIAINAHLLQKPACDFASRLLAREVTMAIQRRREVKFFLVREVCGENTVVAGGNQLLFRVAADCGRIAIYFAITGAADGNLEFIPSQDRGIA